MADDQIYERYQAKAIDEVNALGHDIAEWLTESHPGAAPVLGTGHPLADIMLVKHRPMPAEVQEGVAFFGRAGQADAQEPAAAADRSADAVRDDVHEGRDRARRGRSRARARLAHPRAAHHPAADRGDARRRGARVSRLDRVPAVRSLHRARSARSRAGRRRSRRWPSPTSTAASTTPPRSRRSGTRSRCSAPGTRTSRRTERGCPCPDAGAEPVPGDFGHTPAMPERHIVAMGGGGFLMEPSPLLDDYVARPLRQGRAATCASSRPRRVMPPPTSRPSTARSLPAAPGPPT